MHLYACLLVLTLFLLIIHFVSVVQFTPQYGDSFLEKMRLLLLLDMRTLLGSSSPMSSSLTVSTSAATSVHSNDPMDYIKASIAELNSLGFTSHRSKHRYEHLRRQCINADPNYGVLWFFSKLIPFDPAQQVLETAKGVLLLELQNPSVASVYFQAMMRRKIGMPDVGSMVVRPKSIASSDFVTGLIAANRIGASEGALNIRHKLGDQGFFKLLFGADEIRA